MANESKITTDLEVDEPLEQDADYRFDGDDRQKIDNQILGIQRHLVDALIAGKHATYLTLDATSAAVDAGDGVCSSSDASGTTAKALTAALADAKSVTGIALRAAPPGGKVLISLGGKLPPSITGLAPGASGFVRIDPATGRCERVAALNVGDYGIGTVDEAGFMQVIPGVGAGATGSGVLASRQINTTGSLQGGGDLSADRTLSLVGDSSSPGNSQYYGTDGTGTKGFHTLPAGSSGETNTASNVGGGADVYKEKVGADLRFRTLMAGPGVAISEGADELEISATGYDADALVQADWYINSSTGNDGNDGATGGTALATFGELRKRIGNGKLNPPVDVVSGGREVRIHVPAAGIPEADSLAFSWHLGEDVAVRIIADSVESTTLSGTFSAVQVGNPATNTKWTVTHASLGAAHVGKRIRITAGDRAGTIMWVLADLGGGEVWVSPPSLPMQADPANDPYAYAVPGVTDQTPQVGDAFSVEELSKISLGSVTNTAQAMTSGGGGFHPQITLENIEVRDGNVYGSALRLATQGIFAPFASKIGALVQILGGELIISNCLAVRGYHQEGGGNTWIYGGCANLTAANDVGGPEFGVTCFGGQIKLAADVHVVGRGIKGRGVVINRAAVFDCASSSSDTGGHGVRPGGSPSGDSEGGAIRLTATHMGGDSARLWGSGNAGHGVAVPKGGEFVCDSGLVPTITGTGGDFLHHDQSYAWNHASTASLLDSATAAVVARRIAHTSGIYADIDGVGVQAWGASSIAIGAPRLGVPGNGSYGGVSMLASPFSSEGFEQVSIFNAGGQHLTVAAAQYFLSFLSFHSSTGVRHLYFPLHSTGNSGAYCKTLHNNSNYPIVVCVNDAQPSALRTETLLPGEVATFWFNNDGVFKVTANVREVLTSDATPVYITLATLAVGDVRTIDAIVTIAKADGAVRQSFRLSGLFYGAAGPTATLDGGSLTDASPRGTGTAVAELDLSGANVQLKITGIAATDLVTKFDVSIV